jgi:hypothetical protein
MAGTHATPSITMKVLIKQDVIAPVWIVLKVFHVTEDCSAPLVITREDVHQPLREFVCHFVQRQVSP